MPLSLETQSSILGYIGFINISNKMTVAWWVLRHTQRAPPLQGRMCRPCCEPPPSGTVAEGTSPKVAHFPVRAGGRSIKAWTSHPNSEQLRKPVQMPEPSMAIPEPASQLHFPLTGAASFPPLPQSGSQGPAAYLSCTLNSVSEPTSRGNQPAK